jgi:hypothetical protein
MRPTSPCLSAADPGLPLDVFSAALDDPRPFPSEAALQQLGQALMTELLDLLLTGALEDHAGLVAESLIGGLHTAALRLDRAADRSREALARGLREFDGSEVADHDLQESKARTDAADAAVRAVELVRDAAAEAYATATGETWTPWRGGIRPTGATAAQIDAAHALRTREALRLAETDPGAQVVAFRGAPGAASPEDAARIFDALNWARETWPDMSLALTGAPGAEQIAKRWAAQKRVRIVLARPDFERHGRAAPFRANDALMALQPVCVLALAASLQPEPLSAKPFGPVLSLVQSAQAAGVRCVRIRAATTPAPAD